MTKKNIGKILLAFLPFAAVLAVMNGSALAISAGAGVIGGLIGGMRGAVLAYQFLSENLNLYTCMIYLAALTVMLPWFYFAVVRPAGLEPYLDRSIRRLRPVSFLWILLLAFALEHALTFVIALTAGAAPQAFQEYTDLMETAGMTEYSLLWYFSTLILPPVVEEIVFRGMMMEYLRRAGIGFLAANLLQALCFGIYHGNLIQGVYTAVVGFVLGYVAYRYESLAAPVFLHFCFNLFGTVLVDLENTFLAEPLRITLILQSVPLLVLSVLMIQLRVGEKKRPEKDAPQEV